MVLKVGEKKFSTPLLRIWERNETEYCTIFITAIMTLKQGVF